LKVTLIFRKRLSLYNSIEELFGSILLKLQDKVSVGIQELRYPSNRPTYLLKNMMEASKYKGSINHITGDVHYVSLVLPGSKTILTIHDYYSARRGSWFNQLFIRIFWYYLPAWKVRYITVISEWSKQELIKVIPFARRKIRVVPNPVMIPSGPYDYTFNHERTDILMVGTKPNKNLEGMLAACRDLKCSLTILGKLSEEQMHLLEKYGIVYTHHFNIPYEKVIRLYRHSDLLFFASFEEGFGLPILEAQAVGRPVITSNRAAMPDTAGEGACLVDPYDVRSMRKGLLKVIEDGKYREELVQKGLENIKRFDPERIAGMYMELYEEIAQGSKQGRGRSWKPEAGKGTTKLKAQSSKGKAQS